MSIESESDFPFTIFISRHFQKTMEKAREQQEKRRIYECVSLLAKGFPEWKRLNVKKIEVSDSRQSIRAARVNDQMRILFEGPIGTKRFGPILFIHDVCNHDEYVRTIRRIAGLKADEGEFPEVELTTAEMMQGSKGLESSMAVFSKPIPIRVLLSPDRIDTLLTSTKANLLLTQGQIEALGADRPLLIHGQAGSGKTTLLCHRLALSILSRRSHPLARLVFLSYNEKLVKQAFTDTKEILRDQHGVSEDLEGIEFIPFPTFLKRYVPYQSQFEIDRYVPFGRFKRYYEMYQRGNSSARKIPAEVAWHGIRSILKGACIPPSRPPLSRVSYQRLARRRKDFPQVMFEDIYRIGQWYQKEVIRDKNLWDDQDLAWAALGWIMAEKERNPTMLLYDEIFCDEGQDLTEIEFRLLVALCKPPDAKAREGLPLAFAGDPLQTINPTGFRWSIVGSEVYRVQGKPVKLQELRENFRSDKRIVAFANRIQEIRSRYMGQPLAQQEAFEKDGDIPQIVIAETNDEVSFLKEKLGELPPESAVIVWPEESDEVSNLFETDEVLNRVDRQLDLYTVSEAKGLEFRVVVLHRFGSSPDVVKWKDHLAKKLPLPLEDEIPFLYFLNRLYVAVTRAKSFLIVVDTKNGVDDFWSLWKDALYFLPRPEIRNLLGGHPAFREEVSEVTWRQWAETLFEHGERTHDLRLYERARRAYEKAKETQNVKRVDARLMEIAEKWEQAGHLYLDINEFEQAGHCYEKVGKWKEASKAYSMLPTTPETRRRAAICRFKQDTRAGANEFYEYVLCDDALDVELLQELGNVLFQLGDHKRAAQMLLQYARSCRDKEALVQAAYSFYVARDFENAEKTYEEAGETKLREYQLSRAENMLHEGDLARAARLFFKNNAYEKVIEVYKLAERERGIASREQLLELTADSSFQLGKYEMALSVYNSLLLESKRSEDPKVLLRIAECLEKLNRKPEAYEYYRMARSYEKAADLAEGLGRPREEIISLKIEGARERADFDTAVELATEKGDERLIHELKGHSYKYHREHLKAVKEFIEAEEWNEALGALDQFTGGSDFTQLELHNQSWCIARAVAKSGRTIHVDKEKLMRVIRQIQEDPDWEKQVVPSDMGLVYEKCAGFSEAIRYYESYIHEQWAQAGWLRVMYAYRDSFIQVGDLKNAQKIENDIPLRKKVLGF